ncbi:hypothetical protein HDIA_2758 [Hartmannibacter diazotrophicus]|uniref:Urease accessory protein UreH-like transmembrane domain-containing protein n=1 Tax=Hartmannibacter diazotrophicus TaxID=1482074 RepID=A0A2C9D7Z4_9HYPH|nr:sulfite exporter TauE/SafE family protein [Hartmannibacter diazotrophicus]SON56299.1 hypothetical protein HDIA_2758 [Hartmannibacter diazotrophicus]
MDVNSLTFFGGLLLGLASSLHCAGMCGAIASSLMFAISPDDKPLTRLRILLSAQAGKAVAYTAAGAAVGLAGTSLYGLFDQAVAYRFLQWAAAATLAWIGLTLTGLAPPLSLLDRLTRPVTRFMALNPVPAGARPGVAFGSGLAWGFLPCGMVFGALFYAMLSGSALSGAAVMFGFGLGTMPSVTMTALGLGGMKSLARRPQLRIAMGLGLIGLAALSVVTPMGGLFAFCLPPAG